MFRNFAWNGNGLTLGEFCSIRYVNTKKKFMDMIRICQRIQEKKSDLAPSRLKMTDIGNEFGK